ncbi:MAG TPA: hypothetical protein VK511_10465 [Gemmatimonadaceae bacterium]|nr:hypothetical protein [Gemmatimonadaceae bacterium]
MQLPRYAPDSGAAWSAKWISPSACPVAVQPKGMSRETIYLDARMAPHTNETLVAQAELIAQDVALELRTKLGGSESAAPDIGATIIWYAIPAELIVVARPDGSMAWRGVSASGDSTAVTLLSTALDSVRRKGGALMLWPEGYAADSIVLRLSLLQKYFIEEAGAAPTQSKVRRFLAFTMLTPMESPALPKGRLHVTYPNYNEQHRISGYLLTQFVVDTNGKAIMSTFRDLWPESKPRLSGALNNYYTDFVAAVREGVAAQSFTPAHRGSCAVRQIVQLPVEFVQRGSGYSAP